MPAHLSWIIWHSVAILAALLAGPMLSRMSWVQYFIIPLTRITDQDAWRLTTDTLALTLIVAFAVAAHERLSNNGRGSNFLRVILFPSATLLAILFLGRTIRTHGLSLIEYIGPHNVYRGYTLALV